MHEIDTEMRAGGALRGDRIELIAVSTSGMDDETIEIEGDPRHIREMLLQLLSVVNDLMRSKNKEALAISRDPVAGGEVESMLATVPDFDE